MGTVSEDENFGSRLFDKLDIPIKKTKKKSKKQRVSLKDIPLTRAQVIMRDEMLRSGSATLATLDDDGRFVVKPQDLQPQLFDDEIDDETPEQSYIEADGARAIGQVLDEVLGLSPVAKAGRRDQVVSAIAIEVINSGPGLQLALKDWNTVQSLIEMGIRAGSDAEQSGRL